MITHSLTKSSKIDQHHIHLQFSCLGSLACGHSTAWPWLHFFRTQEQRLWCRIVYHPSRRSRYSSTSSSYCLSSKCSGRLVYSYTCFLNLSKISVVSPHPYHLHVRFLQWLARSLQCRSWIKCLWICETWSYSCESWAAQGSHILIICSCLTPH